MRNFLEKSPVLFGKVFFNEFEFLDQKLNFRSLLAASPEKQLGDVLLGQCLEALFEHLSYFLHYQVLVRDLHHLQEESHQPIAGFDYLTFVLLAFHKLSDLSLCFEAKYGAEFGYYLLASGFQKSQSTLSLCR